MKKNFFVYMLIAFTGSLLTLNAQNAEESATLDQGPLSGQFDYAIENSSKYEEFRVVQTAWLYKLKANVIDSIESLHTQIRNYKAETDSLNNHIETLNEELDDAKAEMNEAITAKNSISFLGNEMLKGKYNSIMWGLVIILALGLAFIFLLFKRSHFVTNQMRQQYAELEKEFDAHKKRALEKEKVMARQHLNELNKLRGRE